jgi:hypothetical protein
MLAPTGLMRKSMYMYNVDKPLGMFTLTGMVKMGVGVVDELIITRSVRNWAVPG